MTHYQTRGRAIDFSQLQPGDSALLEAGRRLAYRRFDGSVEYFLAEAPAKEWMKQWVDALVQQKVNEAVSALATPLKVGDIIDCLNTTIDDQFIIDRGDAWLWLRLDLFSGTIGSAQSNADLKDDRLEKLFLAWKGTPEKWANGEAISLPDFRGRGRKCAGQGAGLAPHAIGESIGEEQHLQTEQEMPSHNHRSARGGGSNRGSPGYFAPPLYYWGNAWAADLGISSPAGGGEPFNVLDPSVYLVAIAFLGVRA